MSFPSNEENWPVVLCRVEELEYGFPAREMFSLAGSHACKSIITHLLLTVIGVPQSSHDGNSFFGPPPYVPLPRTRTRTGKGKQQQQRERVRMRISFNVAHYKSFMPDFLVLER
jgi:hypothetical protein